MSLKRATVDGIRYATLQTIFLGMILWLAYTLSAPVAYLAAKGMLPQAMGLNFFYLVHGLGLAFWLTLAFRAAPISLRETIGTANKFGHLAANAQITDDGQNGVIDPAAEAGGLRVAARNSGGDSGAMH